MNLTCHRPSFVVITAAAVLALGVAPSAPGQDLYTRGSWPALVSDRTAEKVGDSLTVLIQEASQASDTSQNSRQSGAGASGQISGLKHSGQLGASGDYNYSTTGQSGRSGQLIATISVVVDNVLPNGDLHVAGSQLIDLNGEKTQIHLTGRVRRSDINSNDSVLSTSLADATINYGGPGLNGKDSKPGLLRRMMSWFKP
jgi:flagellar L-ring protein precursor FlgH